MLSAPPRSVVRLSGRLGPASDLTRTRLRRRTSLTIVIGAMVAVVIMAAPSPTSGLSMTTTWGISGTGNPATSSGCGSNSGSYASGILTPAAPEVQFSMKSNSGSTVGCTGNGTWYTWGNAQTTPWYNWVGHASYSLDLNYSLNMAANDVYASASCGATGSTASARATLSYLYNIWDLTTSTWVWTTDITGVLYDTGAISCSGASSNSAGNSAMSNTGTVTPNYIISGSTPLLTAGDWYRVKIQASCYTTAQTSNSANTFASAQCIQSGSDSATLDNAGVFV
jgi:hypothetical protein